MRDLTIKVFADGADLATIRTLAANPLIKGFTTNPTLMRKAGVTNYRAFALEAIEAAAGLPISFEVFADDFPTMAAQAREIASWGKSVYVKIPVTNSAGVSSAELIRDLSNGGTKLNVTAVMTLVQLMQITDVLHPSAEAIVSVFAGRIADSGLDPMPVVGSAVEWFKTFSNVQVLWASPREVFNVTQAELAGCHIITLPPDLLAKVKDIGRNLTEYSRETVEMFRRDAVAAGYEIPLSLEKVA